MSRFRKLSHTTWHCQYHIIWALIIVWVTLYVTPAKAGVQPVTDLDSRLRGNDGRSTLAKTMIKTLLFKDGFLFKR